MDYQELKEFIESHAILDMSLENKNMYTFNNYEITIFKNGNKLICAYEENNTDLKDKFYMFPDNQLDNKDYFNRFYNSLTSYHLNKELNNELSTNATKKTKKLKI
jgi:hypothetical protein